MSTTPRRRSTLAAATVVSLLGAACGIGASLRADLFDDAFITAVFARHLAQGQGLTWVAGDPPFWGPTSLVQVTLLAGASTLGVDLQVASQLLAALFWAASCGLLVLLLQESGQWAALSAGMLMALSPVPLRLAAGMESGMFVALVLLALLLQTHLRPVAAGLVAAVATFARPEGILLFPLLMSVSAWRESGLWKRRVLVAARAIVPGALLLGGAIALTLGFLGTVVPQSIVAKRAFGCDVSGCFSPAGVARALLSAVDALPALVLVATAAMGAIACFRDPGGRLLGFWCSAVLAAFMLGRAPDSPWYYTNLLPALCACAGAAAAARNPTTLRRLGRLLVVGSITWSAVDAARGIASDPWGRNTRWNSEKRRLADVILSDMQQEHKTRARVMAYEVGYFGWSVPGRVDDLLGLVTPGFQPCLQGRNGDDVLAETSPDYVALVDTPAYRATGCIRTAPRLAAEYRLIASFPTAWGNHYEIWAQGATAVGASIAP